MNQQPSEKIHFRDKTPRRWAGASFGGSGRADMARVVDFLGDLCVEIDTSLRTDHAQPAPQHDPAPSARSPRGAARVLLLDGRGLGRALCHRDAQAWPRSRPRALSNSGRAPRPGAVSRCHPSAALLDRFGLIASRIGRLAQSAFGGADDDRAGDYFYGGSYVSGQAAIAPPRALLSPLKLAGGLRILVHGDPTFMVMETLKRQFEQIVGTDIHQRAFSNRPPAPGNPCATPNASAAPMT